MAYQDFAGKRRPSSSAYPEKSSGYVTVDDPITGTGKFQIDNLIGSVAPIFDPTVDYTEGQSVMYLGKLYTFKTDHTAGAWEPSDVDSADLQDKFGKRLTSETDLNNITENGVYSVSTSMSNYPTGAENGALIVFNISNNRKMQMLAESMNSDNSVSKLYYRCAEYTNNTWSKWELVVNVDNLEELLRSGGIAIVYNRLNANTDLNTITSAGYYSLPGIYTWTNAPSGFSYGFLISYVDSTTRVLQVIYNQENGQSYSRSYINGTWSNWILNGICINTNSSTDLNNYLESGIYAVRTTYTNYPTGESNNGTLVVMNYASSARSVQMLFTSVASASSPSVMYIRNRSYNNVWGKWEKIVTQDNIGDVARSDGQIIVFRNLQADTDMNDCTDSGYYSLNTQYTWTNVPSGWTYGFVVVYSISGRYLQIAYNQGTGDVWQRSYALGAWGSWRRINGSYENCAIKYDSANTWEINFGDFKVNLIHAVNADKQMDTYNLSKITDKAGNVICPQGTDIIGPAKIDGEVDFIGGVHGYEIATSVKVICDGVVQTLDSSLNTTANEINIFIETSDISHVSLSEVWTREIAIAIKKNEILVSSKYTITSATDLTIFRMTNGGLMAAYHDDLGSAWMPNKILSPIPSTSISNASKKNVVCEFNTKYGTIRVENIVGHELATYNGWWQNFQNETPKRLKSYFDIISSNTTVHNGDVFVGVAKYTMTPKA